MANEYGYLEKIGKQYVKLKFGLERYFRKMIESNTNILELVLENDRTIYSLISEMEKFKLFYEYAITHSPIVLRFDGDIPPTLDQLVVDQYGRMPTNHSESKEGR